MTVDRSSAHLSPARLRRAALVTVGLAGAATGLLGGVGWRLFVGGDHDLAAAMWGIAAITVGALLVVSMLARALATLAQRASDNHLAAIRRVEERVERSEREVDQLRQALTIAAVSEPDVVDDAELDEPALTTPSG